MDKDFLKKEEEFRKENKQLELQTKQLLQKVDDMKKFQEFQFQDVRLKPIEVKDLHLPKSVDEMGTKGMLYFYKSKIKSLQDEMEKIQTELKNKNEELKKAHKNCQNLAEEKEKWFLQCNSEKNMNAKFEKHIAAATTSIQIKDGENNSLKKEIEQLKNELKNASNELSASENRLKRSLQEMEKEKNVIKSLRQEEKEYKEEYRTNLKSLTATVKQIQKHKSELLRGYKKQLQLVDNLKKQKSHVESCKALELAESEFFKLLDWKIDE